MKLGVLNETSLDEARIALTPQTISKLIATGHEIVIESGAGKSANLSDSALRNAGASIAKTAKGTVSSVDILLAVGRPDPGILTHMKKGSAIIALLDPFDDPGFVQSCANKNIDAFAMELIPRISRAQSMDALSSQSNLAGYRAVIEAAEIYGRALPMMMTAAGTVAAAKVFVMGAGVAGLQAIATARRLGAIVSATDVRPAAKEQVASLGAKFIAVEDDEFKKAETAGGYARQMSPEYQKKQAELIATHIAKQDIVITTALIPGRAAPRLIDSKMVKSMADGSVIIDMAAERGGNCELTDPGKVVVCHGVTVAGFTNLVSRLAADSSALYGRNIAALLPLLSAENGSYSPDWEDEIVLGANVSRDGKITNENLAKALTAKTPPVKKPPAKKPASKTATKKSATKKSVSKRTTAKKPAAKRAAPKKKGS